MLMPPQVHVVVEHDPSMARGYGPIRFARQSPSAIANNSLLAPDEIVANAGRIAVPSLRIRGPLQAF